MFVLALTLSHFLRWLTAESSSQADDNFVVEVIVMLAVAVAFYHYARFILFAGRKQKWGSVHPPIDRVVQAGDFVQAQQLLRERMAKAVRRYGMRSPQVRHLMMELGRVQYQSEEFKEAEESFTQALGIEETNVGPESDDLGHEPGSSLRCQVQHAYHREC